MVKSVSSTQLQRRIKIAFGTFLTFFLLMAISFLAIRHSEKEDGIPWPLRAVLDFNSGIGEKILNPERVDISKFEKPAQGNKARINGNLGLRSATETADWKIKVVTPGTTDAGAIETSVALNEILKLPKTEESSQFKCIEGWSEVMSFGGVRFSDFLKFYHLGTRNGQAPDWENHPQDLFRYVGLETPDGEYYVSIDMKSLMNPQALLAYEQNGEPLSLKHGAPLRLYLPNKYGVKSLKRIGKIIFSDEPQPDFWGEQGYDWFIGL